MRVAFFSTCLVDLFKPSIGLAVLDLLAQCGIEPVFPEDQTCCGQPAFNSGDQVAARALAQKFVSEFEGFDHVVIPSGSCAGMVVAHYGEVLADDPAWAVRFERLRPTVRELTDFLVNVVQLPDKIASFPHAVQGTVTYHDSCSGLRELGIKQQPRQLLAKAPGVTLKEMTDCENCCGFGGAFSIKYGDISARIAEAKCKNVEASGADTVVLGDLGCMLNIEGRLRRRGDTQTRVLHIAQALTGRG